ncbi:hypothetical protein LRU_01053 [Ligilactobacillus ruminis SPM0211]|uniref:Uncharacterized protein n=1 Tax=Ligilactobacillus ruminis SPM0211 TaxID=1040964 RepID=F7R045_9LACO|nr:hypothetical protein LRU_01053 [Ligilactobacillus ruminis SPM0211]
MKNIDETLKFVSALHFARNQGLEFTGRIQKSAFCP